MKTLSSLQDIKLQERLNESKKVEKTSFLDKVSLLLEKYDCSTPIQLDDQKRVLFIKDLFSK
jgi:hypothetical protein